MFGKNKQNNTGNAGFPGFQEEGTPDLEVNPQTLQEPTNPLAIPTPEVEEKVPEIEPKQPIQQQPVQQQPIEQKSEVLGTTNQAERPYLQVTSGELLANGTAHYEIICNRALAIGQKIYLQ